MMILSRKVIAGMLSLGLLFGTSVPTQASEDNTVILGSGGNSVRFSPGTYDLKVEMRKAGEEDSDSMAAGALHEDAVLTVHEDGTASVDAEMQETTIMGFAGVAATVMVHQEHNTSSETISAAINSTMSFKAGSWGSTYTVPKEVTITHPFSNQDGVYIGFQIRYSLGTMDQTAYFLFDYTPYRADYTAFDAAVATYEADKAKYTTSSTEVVDAYINSVSYCEPLDSQSVVDAQTAELAVLLVGLELRDVEVRDAEMRATIAVNEATFMVEIPSEIGLGELSVEEDTKIPYQVSVEVAQGNNGTTTYQVSTDTTGELTSGNNKLAYGNTFDTQSFTETNTVEAFFMIEADTVAKAASGSYEGEVMFTIESTK